MAHCAQWHESNKSYVRRFMASYLSFSHYFQLSMISPSQLQLCIPFPRLLPHCAVCAPLLCFDILYAVWHANCVCCWDDCLRPPFPVHCPSVSLATSSAPASASASAPAPSLPPRVELCAFPVQCTNTQAGKRQRLRQRGRAGGRGTGKDFS